jgi:hypothetical protein
LRRDLCILGDTLVTLSDPNARLGPSLRGCKSARAQNGAGVIATGACARKVVRMRPGPTTTMRGSGRGLVRLL